ncbi:MAG: hypothetical protein KF789_15095 [Bdellovibrionaceae bacterium]|nr:hypothetical protein [Pseudobdellovibrionaceae bacterium]
MKFNEISTQVSAQHSALRAFPSQASSLESVFLGQNQRAGLEVQLECAQMLAEQSAALGDLIKSLNALRDESEQHQLALRKREIIEDKVYLDNLRLSRIAAWSGLVSAVLAALGVIVQIALK